MKKENISWKGKLKNRKKNTEETEMSRPNIGRQMGSSNYMWFCATNKVPQQRAQDINVGLFWALARAAHVRNSGQNSFVFFSRTWTTKI